MHYHENDMDICGFMSNESEKKMFLEYMGKLFVYITFLLYIIVLSTGVTKHFHKH